MIKIIHNLKRNIYNNLRSSSINTLPTIPLNIAMMSHRCDLISWSNHKVEFLSSNNATSTKNTRINIKYTKINPRKFNSKVMKTLDPSSSSSSSSCSRSSSSSSSISSSTSCSRVMMMIDQLNLCNRVLGNQGTHNTLMMRESQPKIWSLTLLRMIVPFNHQSLWTTSGKISGTKNQFIR